MAEYLIKDTTLQSIADAIKEKTGSSDPIPVTEMADKIRGIITGSSDVLDFNANDENLKYFSYLVDPRNRRVHVYSVLYDENGGIQDLAVPSLLGGYPVVLMNGGG